MVIVFAQDVTNGLFVDGTGVPVRQVFVPTNQKNYREKTPLFCGSLGTTPPFFEGSRPHEGGTHNTVLNCIR
jgi:hypothetical protein